MPFGTAYTLSSNASLSRLLLLRFARSHEPRCSQARGFLWRHLLSHSTYGLYRTGSCSTRRTRTSSFLRKWAFPNGTPAPPSPSTSFYLLFEPRLHLQQFSIVPTFFWHPAYYLAVLQPFGSGKLRRERQPVFRGPRHDLCQGRARRELQVPVLHLHHSRASSRS